VTRFFPLPVFRRWVTKRPAALRPARVRARRALLSLGVTFASASLILSLAAESMPRVRDPMSGDKLRRLKALSRAAHGRPIVVFLGSSRTGFAFHGVLADAQLRARNRPAVCFNFGIPAGGPVTELQALDRTLAAGVVPDLVLVEVLPMMLHRDAEGPRERLFLPADRFDAAEVRHVQRLGFPAADVSRAWWKARLAPWWAYRFQLLGRAVPSFLPFDRRFDYGRNGDAAGWGSFPFDTVTDADRARGQARAFADYAPTLSVLTPGGGGADALREIIDTCRTRGIAVRLVLMPESTVFRSWYGPGADDRLTAFLASLDVGVVDARGWLSDSSFSDGHHPMRPGAVAFTSRLVATVIAPILGTGGPGD